MRLQPAACALALLLAGCASMTTEEKVHLGLASADIASTYIALGDGGREANPLFSGRDRMTTVAQLVVVNAAFQWWIHRVLKKRPNLTIKPVLWLRSGVLAWNLKELAR